MKPTAHRMRYLLILLIQFLLLESAYAQPSPSSAPLAPPKPKDKGTVAAPTKDTPNVVLGRELIHATKQTEELVALKQSAVRIRNQLGRFRGQTKDIDSLQQNLKALQQEMDDRKSRVQSHRELLDKLFEEGTRPEADRNNVQRSDDTSKGPPKEPEPPAPAPPPPNAQWKIPAHANSAALTLIDFHGEPHFIQQGTGPAEQPQDEKKVNASSIAMFRINSISRLVEQDLQVVAALLKRAQNLTRALRKKENDAEFQRNELDLLAGNVDSMMRDSAVLDADLVAVNGSLSMRMPMQLEQFRFPESEGLGRYLPENDDFGSAVSGRRAVPPIPIELPTRMNAVASAFTEAQLLLSELERRIQAISSEITEADELMQAIKSIATDMTDGVKALDEKLSPILQNIQERLQTNQERRQSIEGALADRDSGLNQFQINQYLVYAVYMMVISIVVLFVLLKWYPATLTDLIVEQRVFVEVLSMGFLLLTVIILGSGKLITGEGLAGLLGTIAGYIFAKKTADMIGASRDRRAVGAVERELMQARLDLVSLEGELDKLRREGGVAPNEKTTSAMKALEQKIVETRARAERLAESVTIIAQSKAPPYSSEDGSK